MKHILAILHSTLVLLFDYSSNGRSASGVIAVIWRKGCLVMQSQFTHQMLFWSQTYDHLVSLASLRELSCRLSTFCAWYVIELLAAGNFLHLWFSLKLLFLSRVLIRCIFSMMRNNWKSTNSSVKFNFIVIDRKHLTLCTLLTSRFTTQLVLQFKQIGINSAKNGKQVILVFWTI